MRIIDNKRYSITIYPNPHSNEKLGILYIKCNDNIIMFLCYLYLYALNIKLVLFINKILREYNIILSKSTMKKISSIINRIIVAFSLNFHFLYLIIVIKPFKILYIFLHEINILIKYLRLKFTNNKSF